MKTLQNITNIKDVELLENLGVSIDFEHEEETMSPDFENEEDIAYVTEQYNNGNMAAWFCAKVSVSFRDFIESDYLGGCSYKSFKEFTNEENGYYIDMINTCIDEINRQIESINYGITRKWNIRKAKNLIKPYNLHIVSNNVLQTL